MAPTAKMKGASERAKREALDRATRKIRVLKEAIVEKFYELGVELRDVRDGELHRAKGYATFAEYLEREGLVSESKAYELVRIVERFTPRAAKMLGFEKLDAAVRFMDATPAEEDPARVAEIKIRTGRRTPEGRVEVKPLADATAAEIEAAARAEKAKRSRGKAPDRRARPVAGDRFAADAEKKLRKAKLGHVRLDARKAPKGTEVDEGSGFVVDILGLGPGLATRAIAALTT
jgi:hypothetical protein